MSRQTAHIWAGGLLCIFLLLGAFTTAFVLRPNRGIRLKELRQRNVLLTGWVDSLRTRFASFTGTLDELAERERAYRRLAGLAPFTASRSPWLPAARNPNRATNGTRDLQRLTSRADQVANRWNRTSARLTATGPAHVELAAIPSILPATGYLTNAFTLETHPLFDGSVAHEGIDIAAPAGRSVRASARGRVSFAGTVPGYGRLVVLDHGNGYETKYAHLMKIRVNPGQVVLRGERIGSVGETGIAAGPHLHYEVLLHGWPRNPLDYTLDWQTGLMDPDYRAAR